MAVQQRNDDFNPPAQRVRWVLVPCLGGLRSVDARPSKGGGSDIQSIVTKARSTSFRPAPHACIS